ncbi:hypothetical protein GCM10022291_24260 [Postechiella marina]|uniref:Uncharacterized protein n=1 Tax=Postechiella marina TaxID=943941 RepID=A0ABP8CC62_9FLAO
MEKQTIILNQAMPNTHPGGVQGALFRFIYQDVLGPFSISQLPTPKALKLIIKKNVKYFKNFI